MQESEVVGAHRDAGVGFGFFGLCHLVGSQRRQIEKGLGVGRRSLVVPERPVAGHEQLGSGDFDDS